MSTDSIEAEALVVRALPLSELLMPPTPTSSRGRFGLTARKQRGEQIVKDLGFLITLNPTGVVYSVPSAAKAYEDDNDLQPPVYLANSGHPGLFYNVDMSQKRCTCIDFTKGTLTCKHMFATSIWLLRQLSPALEEIWKRAIISDIEVYIEQTKESACRAFENWSVAADAAEEAGGIFLGMRALASDRAHEFDSPDRPPSRYPWIL